MNLVTILAYALLFWRAEEPLPWLLVPGDDIAWTALIVLAQPPLIALATALVARRTVRLLVLNPNTPQAAQRFYHRASLALRTGVLTGFAVTMLLTRWPDWFVFGRLSPALQIAGDLVALTPYFAGVTVLWIAAYPAERMLRTQSLGRSLGAPETGASGWSLRSYLDFQLRHHVLIVAVPMTLILFASDLARGYEQSLQSLAGYWAPDAALGAAVVSVFVMSPLMLRRIWRTQPLQTGPLRQRLEAIGRGIGLRFHDILVWNSGGMMINAAVMGIFAPVRYVLLSDALLESLSARQIEAVFGHEAGHVRHRHIQYFLAFALVGWLLAVGVMELLAQTVASSTPENGPPTLLIQAIGVTVTVLFWGVGFGWLSRRFERQADVFGASCVTPEASECRLPCSVHLDDHAAPPTTDRVCATGATIFVSALESVAALNGIPREERSWRHSSIGSRVRFLASLAGDPARATRFQRRLRRVKASLLILALLGSVATAVYLHYVPQPAILQPPAGGS